MTCENKSSALTINLIW